MASSASIHCSYNELLELTTCAFFVKLFSEKADAAGCIPMIEVARSLQEARPAILQYVEQDGNFYAKRSYFFNFGTSEFLQRHFKTNCMALQPEYLRSFVALINRFVYSKTKGCGSVKVNDVLAYCRANHITRDPSLKKVTRSRRKLAKFLRPFSFLFTIGYTDSIINSCRDIPLEAEIQDFLRNISDYFQNPAGRHWRIHDVMDTIDIGTGEKVSGRVDSVHIHANGGGEGLALYQGFVDPMNISSPSSCPQAPRSTFSPVESVHSSSPGSFTANGYGMLQGCSRCGHVKPETNNAQTQTAKCLEDFMRELPLRQLMKK